MCDCKDCEEQYHIGCARAHGLYVEAQPTKYGDPVLSSYCKIHSLMRLDHYPRFPREYPYDMADTARLASEIGVKKEAFDIICSYWRVKRRVHPISLISRLRILSENGYTPSTTLSSPEYHARFVKLRQDFERARMLVDLVRKRELAKRQHLQTFMDLFDVTEDLTLNPHKRGATKQI